MASHPDEWRSHAICDPTSRLRKAEKIVRLLERRPLDGLQVLDIGAGSGDIAAHVARAVGERGAVTAVDRQDQRTVRDGFTFVEVDGVGLPFPDAAFDVVITNHVIEHVGDRAEQARHLREVRRVLAPGGLAYLAVPNRWTVIEPHYRLPFLSWLPLPVADRYVRWTRRGLEYDCRLLSPNDVRLLAAGAGLRPTSISVEALRVMDEARDGSVLHAAAARVPTRVLRSLSGAFPTSVFLLDADDARSPDTPTNRSR